MSANLKTPGGTEHHLEQHQGYLRVLCFKLVHVPLQPVAIAHNWLSVFQSLPVRTVGKTGRDDDDLRMLGPEDFQTLYRVDLANCYFHATRLEPDVYPRLSTLVTVSHHLEPSRFQTWTLTVRMFLVTSSLRTG